MMKRAKTVIIHFYLRIYPCVSFTADENMNEEMMNNMKEDEPRFSCSLFFSRVVLDDWVENKRVRDEIDPKKYKIFTIKMNFRLTI